MILFACSESESTAARLRQVLPRVLPGQFRVSRFDNGELFIEVETPVAGEHCVILGSIAPPDARLLSVLLLAHTLRKEGASEVTGVLPYLAYSRHDKNKRHQSMAAAWTGELVRASGLDRVITIDVHSTEDERLFPIPLISISPAAIFGAAIRHYQLSGATLVAPDKGAIPRCEAVRRAAGLESVAISWFEKQRDATGIRLSGLIGGAGTQVVLVDDILDTGATLVSACRRLVCAGVKDIQIMITHGVFTGKQWEHLWDFGVSRIFCTDSVPLQAGMDRSRVVVLSVDPLLESSLRAYDTHEQSSATGAKELAARGLDV